MKRYLKTFSASLVAAVILVALLGYLLLFERDGSEKIETPQLLFPEVREAQINSITLKYPERYITLEMNGDKWFLTKDSGRVAADADSVRDLLGEVSEIEIEKVAAESSSSLDDFGLNSPRVEVILKTASDEYRLSAGSETPIGVGTYVKVGGQETVLIVDKHFIEPFLDKTENDFREKPD